MKSDSLKNQIIKGSQMAGKKYGFDDTHDPSIPAQMWFQESEQGKILFIVFYSQACRWSRCLGCNLPSKMSSKHVSYESLIAQINNVFQDPKVIEQKQVIRKVIVSNNGSILDQDTFSSTALMYLIAQLNINLPNLSVLSLETRPEYVEFSELDFISRALAEGQTHTQLEIAIGFEAYDEYIRNQVFFKGLTFDMFEHLLEKMAPFNFHLKCYFMQKPVPGITDKDAKADIENAIDYLSKKSVEYKVQINMHLNPTYVAYGTLLEHAFNKGEYSPPFLCDVAAAVKHCKGKPISIFVGLSDEGLAVKGGSFIREGDEAIVAKLEQFNKTQDTQILE